MDINTEIPAPSKPEESLADIGYDVPRDTISREFIRSAKTARQLHSQHPRDEGLRYLMPSPSSSSSKLACESPRIIISPPDDEIPLPQLRCNVNPLPSSKGESKKFEPVSSHSCSKAIAVAVVVVIIMLLLLVLLVYA